MDKKEREILSDLVKKIIDSNKEEAWWELKYQTRMGPTFFDFPYYPAALECFQDEAKRYVNNLPEEKKAKLVELWNSSYRVIKLDTKEKIINQYSLIVLDEIIRRARIAGARTDF